MSATKPQTTLERLRERIPDSLLRSRKQGGNTLSYISWYDACNLLDERAPGWSMEIKQVGEIAGKVYVRVALTIEGITRENIGCEDEELKGYGDVFSNSVGMALRRAAALFGLGRHLYDKTDNSKQQRPRQETSGSTSEGEIMISDPQIVAINSIGNKKNLEVIGLCMERYNRKPDGLTFRQASDYIQWLGKQ